MTGSLLTLDPLAYQGGFGAIISRQGSNTILVAKLLSFFFPKEINMQFLSNEPTTKNSGILGSRMAHSEAPRGLGHRRAQSTICQDYVTFRFLMKAKTLSKDMEGKARKSTLLFG